MPFDVKAFRQRMGLTQVELAKLLGASERAVRRWEHPTHSMAPRRVFRNQMVRMELERQGGMATGTPATIAPTVRRKLPATISGIGIMPSSY